MLKANEDLLKGIEDEPEIQLPKKKKNKKKKKRKETQPEENN